MPHTTELRNNDSHKLPLGESTVSRYTHIGLEVSIEMKTVTVYVFGGSIATKIVVEDLGDVLLVTTQEEWDASKKENRSPTAGGFKREYVYREDSV
jgi:hypothetical protein